MTGERAEPLTAPEYFDSRAAKYWSDVYEGPPSNHYQLLLRRRRELLSAMIAELDGPSLELGCGPGALSAALRGRGPVTLADVSYEMVVTARARLGAGAAGAQLSAADLPFRDCAFNLVVAAGLLEYVKDEQACLREMHRVIAPGGALLVTFPAPKPFEHTLRRLTRPALLRLRGGGEVAGRRELRPMLDHEHSRSNARVMVERAGFHVEQLRAFHYFYYPWSRLFFGPSRMLNSSLESIERVFPPAGYLAQSWIVRARRR